MPDVIAPVIPSVAANCSCPYSCTQHESNTDRRTSLYDMFQPILIFLHFTSVIIWVGGMFFAYYCLRPAAAELLDTPKRLPLWAATFARFFRFTAVAVTVILISGFTMFSRMGLQNAPIGWIIMMVLGLVMILIFCYVYLVLYPRLRLHCSAAAWPPAALALNTIRRWVGINLLLAMCVVAAAVSTR